MNILPHKSWHVYNQKNRDRVRRDEAKAEAEEKHNQERSEAAEQEHRLAVLRQRAQRRLTGSEYGPPTPDDTKISTDAKEHVNFWSDLEQQDTKGKQGNPENEAEAKAKQEKWDRTIAMHLDTGIKGQSPWYTKKRDEFKGTSQRKDDDRTFTKVREDPLNVVKSLLEERDKIRHNRKSKSPSPPPRYRKSKSRYAKQEEAVPVVSDQKDRPLSGIEKLRKERLEREQAERHKALSTLDPHHVNPNDHHRSKGGYNQQFNPQATALAHSSHSHRPYNDHSRSNRRDDNVHRRDYDRERERDRDKNRDRVRERDREREWNRDGGRDQERRHDHHRHRPY
ncbi:hypothetical protein B0O80DRAFT_494997 [Mortierella sp. GBAus27b]|nr:hypothetical protein BGX31_003973 [Mortierella sp. GBA43]KAI8359461.1 hypothetical protein B0O80DRAFT_494997 [Mortierella sp. GBAus27b]